jgi:hypothetical protein
MSNRRHSEPRLKATEAGLGSFLINRAEVNVGIKTATPKSPLQIGSAATPDFGDYLQLPVVISSEKTPPAADCNATDLAQGSC